MRVNGPPGGPFHSRKVPEPPAGRKVEGDFRKALEKARKGLAGENKVFFSAHASRRIESRRIVLGKEDMQKIASAVDRAAAKGSRSSLLLYGEVALVASVPNRTIITAVDGASMKEHVFTNIDSAVVIK